jgi:hypothetical protein
MRRLVEYGQEKRLARAKRAVEAQITSPQVLEEASTQLLPERVQ